MQIITLIIITLGFLGVFFYLSKQKDKKDNDQGLILLQNQINEINKTLDTRLKESINVLEHQFGESAKIVREVTEKLTKLDETNKQVIGFADQLQNLQDILKNPKQRGILGEYYLESLLKNTFPPNNYELQYRFKDGAIVDAVIFVGEQIIPIDSKFSLENYNRLLEEKNLEQREKLEKNFVSDLKNRIDETSKYIRPTEKTVNIAFMFIPAEAIFYDLLANQIGAIKTDTRHLIDYAYNEKHVVIVSPTTLGAYLQVLFQALRAFQIQESTKEIIKKVEELARRLTSYDDYMKKLGGHLGTTINSYNLAYKELGKIDKDIYKIGGKKIKIEPMSLKKPADE